MTLRKTVLLLGILISITLGKIKTYNYAIISTNDFGDTLHVDKLPVLTISGNIPGWKIQLFNDDIRFIIPKNQPLLDSILIRNELTKEIFTIRRRMLKNEELKPAIAKATGKRKLFALLDNSQTRKDLISFLKKAQKIKVVFYNKRATKDIKPMLVEYNVTEFYSLVDKHLAATALAPKHKQHSTPYGQTMIVAGADPFGKGGYAAGLDAVLAGKGGLTRGNPHKKKTAVGSNGTGLTGNRSRANIMRTVRQNMASLKYAYNNRLIEKPGLKGKITVQFAIDEFGSILHAKVTATTMKDPSFEKILLAKIRRWRFSRIDVPGDVTEVTYPFVFTE